MEEKTRTIRFSVIICLMSLDKDKETFKKHKILELLKEIENIKNEDELNNFRKTSFNKFYEIMYKNLTNEEMNKNNYSDLLFKNLMDVNYFNKEYNNKQLNNNILLNEMLNILELRKKLIIYHLINPDKLFEHEQKSLNDYLNEYSKLYEKFMNIEKYNFEKHYKYKCRCEDELIKQYKQNDKLNYIDFYNIIESIEI